MVGYGHSLRPRSCLAIDELMRFVRSELKKNGGPQTPREWKYGMAVGDLLWPERRGATKDPNSLPVFLLAL